MNLQVSAIYQPDADEVLVEFSSTQDDLITLSVADALAVVLLVGTQDLVGTWTYSTLATIATTSDYVTAEQTYQLKFRHPRRRMNLFANFSATYGVDNFTKQVSVGIANQPLTTMDLPDNEIFTRDPFETPLDQENYEAPNPNPVVLAEPIASYAQKFDFTVAANPQVFDPLTYAGGGNRLLMSNQKNSYVVQALNQAPWDLNAFAFMETGVTNLIPNSFFNTVGGTAPYSQQPNGFTVVNNGFLLTETVSSVYVTAVGAQLWTMRFQAPIVPTAFDLVSVAVSTALPVTAGSTYCFSAYAQIQLNTSQAVADTLTLALKWFNGSTPLSTTQVALSTSDYSTLSLASFVSVAPVGATAVIPSVILSTIDPGDDVSLTLFAPQLELGSSPTSRVQGVRVSDQIIIPSYNAANQKIRMEFVPGFAAGVPVMLATGPLYISLTSGGTFRAEVPSLAFVESPVLTFAAGDPLDFTVQTVSGGFLSLYQSGVLVAQQAQPFTPPTTAPLTILGFNGELLRLTVFSRK